jgi:hypothetical protein
VACDSRRGGTPHSPQTLVDDHPGDVARPTPTIEWPTFRAEVPVVCADPFELVADSAGFPPFAIPEFASRVDSLVIGWSERDKVVGMVVGLVSVDVVDLVSGGNWFSVGELPDFDVLKGARGGVPSVALAGEFVVGHGSSQLQEGR